MRIQMVAKVVRASAAEGDRPDVPRRRMIAVGKRQDGRWKVRTSLWRYLAETALSR